MDAASILEQNPPPDITGYPLAPILWVGEIIDTICFPFRCDDTWRSYLPHSWSEQGGPLSYSIGSISKHFPSLLTISQHTTAQQSTKGTEGSIFQNLYYYAFHTSSTALGDLTTPTAFLTALLLVLIIREIKSVLLPKLHSMGRKLGKQAQGEEWVKNNEDRIIKFGEYVIRLIYHSSISFYGVCYFYNKPWWDYKNGGTVHLFYNYPHHEIESGMAWYYLIQSAYNMEAFISLMELSLTIQFDINHGIFKLFKSATMEATATTTTTADTESTNFHNKNKNKTIFSSSLLPFTVSWRESVRGDFSEMAIHHVVTNLLVFGSSFMRFTRIGSMVFLVHDLSDIPVDMSKLANFLKMKQTTTYCFVLMCVVWLYTRLYILPFVIYRSILYESYLLIVDEWTSLYFIGYRYFFHILVCALIVLHSFWFFLLLKIGYGMLTKNQIHDYTEHKSGEKCQIDDKSKKATKENSQAQQNEKKQE